MPNPILIFAGNWPEASQYAQQNGLSEYAVVSAAYHLRNYERGSILVMVGSWAEHPNARSIESEARKREMPIQTGAAFAQGRKS